MSGLVGNPQDRFSRDATDLSILAGYCGPTCLTSTCTSCDSDNASGEITLNLATGEVLGNLTGATVESMAVTTHEDGANVDCNKKARIKVKCTQTDLRQSKTLKKATSAFFKIRKQKQFYLNLAQIEPRCEKTDFLHRRKQIRRSAAQ